MEKVVDFLLEYYIVILVVLVILLITVIGFLVDTKKKKKKRESTESTSSASTDNINMMNGNMENQVFDFNMMNNNANGFNNMGSQAYNNGFNMSPDVSNNMMNQNNMMNNNLSDGFNQVPNMNNNFSEFNQFGVNNNNNNNNNNNPMANQMPNDLMANNSSDTFFVSAYDQTPKIAPRDVVIPKPVEVSPVVGSEMPANNLNNAVSFGPSPAPAIVEPIPAVNTNTVAPTPIEPQPVIPEPLSQPIPNVPSPQGPFMSQTPNVNASPLTAPAMTQNETVVPTGVVSPTPVVNNIQPQMTVPFPNGAAQMPGQTVSGNPMPNNVGAQGGNINPMTSHPVITQPNLVAAPTGNADPNMNIQVNPINLGNNN